MRRSQAPSKRFSNPATSSPSQAFNAPFKSRILVESPVNEHGNTKSEKIPERLPSTVVDGEAKFYSVVYGKPSKKKHKTWEGDGILKVDKKTATLMDDQGSMVGQTTKFTDLDLGTVLFVGGKEVEVMSETTGENLPSKRCHESDEETKSRFKSKRKKKSTTSTPLNLNSYSGPKQDFATKSDFEPLIMPKPDDGHQLVFNSGRHPVSEVVVDPCLCRVLRPHQREGVVFLYKCVTGIRSPQWTGAILADEMGLGKTIQCITLIWTLLKQGPYGRNPYIKKALIVVPSSLVKNWTNEFTRWLGSHRIRVFSVDKNNKPKDFKSYIHFPVMIISYEMFLRCYDDVKDIKFDLIICDEGHRLKNNSIRTSNLLNDLNCKKRLLLSGTPVQNDLVEFFSLVDFVNPGFLGTIAEFRKKFENSIVASREPDAEDEVVEEGEKCAEELNAMTSDFILRRTQNVIGKFLPKKNEYVVFCEPSQTQKTFYSKAAELWSERESAHLSIMTALRKICNHPSLVQKSDLSDVFDNFKVSENDSAKLNVVSSLLKNLENSNEKVVIVSNFTQTLDLIEDKCKKNGYKCLRFDGSTVTSQRNDVVERFNQKGNDVFVLLLSSKAGGVGLNLIGGSRLILYDSDWNPATDLQAMARIWREGQKKDVHLYRLLTSGTLEEKIYQRQIAKAGLSDVVENSSNSLKFSKDEIKDLFTYTGDEKCSTHKMLDCKCDGNGLIPEAPEDENGDLQLSANPKHFKMNQLYQWEHHKAPIEPDIIEKMKLNGSEPWINFVFRNCVQKPDKV